MLSVSWVSNSALFETNGLLTCLLTSLQGLHFCKSKLIKGVIKAVYLLLKSIEVQNILFCVKSTNVYNTIYFACIIL